MSEVTAMTESAVLAAYDFSGFQKLVDVGGDRGTLIASILRACPNVRGVVLDLPHSIELGRRHIQEQELAARCDLIAGDFFERAPQAGDAAGFEWYRPWGSGL